MDKKEVSVPTAETANEDLCINVQRVYDSCSSKEDTRFKQIGKFS